MTKSRPAKKGGTTTAHLPAQFTWQVVRSLGEGAKMTTSAETFASDGTLVPVGPNSWVLRLSGVEVPVAVSPGQRGADGLMFIELPDLLRALSVSQAPSEALADSDLTAPQSNGGSVQLALSRTPNRHLETVYRASGEDLFLVKVAVFLTGR